MTKAEILAALDGALTIVAEGRKCFPCAANKRPATPHGFLDATADPSALRELWFRYPGPLVGVPTGEVSGLAVLDIDVPRHPEATEWWLRNRHRVPNTRTHRTRSRGLHLLFQHTPGLRCWTGRPVIGIDGRADGGYVVWWPAAGLPVLCDAPAAPWPAWLLDELNPPRSTAPAWATDPPRYGGRSHFASGRSHFASKALQNAADRVALAPSGSRNRLLNAEAYRIARLVNEGLLDGQEVADALAAAAFATGLAVREIEATLRNAFRARGLL